jgi:ABC-type antimicrobial peptide transport system permease subunit
MAGRELGRRPGRAILTAVAVALAAALLTALVAIASTGRTRVLDQISHGGALASISVVAAAPGQGQQGLDNPTPGEPRTLTEAALHSMRRIRDVTAVIPILHTPIIVAPPVRPPSGSRLCAPFGGDRRCGGTAVPTYEDAIVGVDLNSVPSLPVSLLAGTFPSSGSTTEVDVTPSYLTHVGLSAGAAHEVVGTRLELGAFRVLTRDFQVGLRWSTVDIVGVVNQEAGAGDVLAYPGLVLSDFRWTAAGRANGDEDAPTSPFTAAIVQADQLSHVNAVRGRIATIGYSSSAPENVIVSVEKYLHVIELILTAIGIVALAIAALGIANALFAAVRERRREIGVMKAIGARDRDVMRTFLVEAGCLGFAGGAVGTLLGIAIFEGIGGIANRYLTSQGLRGVPITVAWNIPVGAAFGAVVISVLAGLLPARRAARLPAREAVEA